MLHFASLKWRLWRLRLLLKVRLHYPVQKLCLRYSARTAARPPHSWRTLVSSQRHQQLKRQRRKGHYRKSLLLKDKLQLLCVKKWMHWRRNLSEPMKRWRGPRISCCKPRGRWMRTMCSFGVSCCWTVVIYPCLNWSKSIWASVGPWQWGSNPKLVYYWMLSRCYL